MGSDYGTFMYRCIFRKILPALKTQCPGQSAELFLLFRQTSLLPVAAELCLEDPIDDGKLSSLSSVSSELNPLFFKFFDDEKLAQLVRAPLVTELFIRAKGFFGFAAIAGLTCL